MGELAEFMVHEVVVRTLVGVSGLGETYAAPYGLGPFGIGPFGSSTFGGAGTPVVHVFVDEKRSLVRGKDGSQVISECTIFDDDLSHAGVWQPGSEVTLPSGRVASVISVRQNEMSDLDLPEHLEISLT